MKPGAPRSFGAQLKALREAAGYTQEELATIAGLSVHAVSALERGERRRPHVETVRALSAALDLSGPTRDALLASARAPAHATAVDELSARLAAPASDGSSSAATPTCRRCGTGWQIPLHVSLRSSGLEALGRPVWRWSSHARSRTRAPPVCCS